MKLERRCFEMNSQIDYVCVSSAVASAQIKVASFVCLNTCFALKGSSTSASGGPGTRKKRMILITLCDALSLD